MLLSTLKLLLFARLCSLSLLKEFPIEMMILFTDVFSSGQQRTQFGQNFVIGCSRRTLLSLDRKPFLIVEIQLRNETLPTSPFFTFVVDGLLTDEQKIVVTQPSQLVSMSHFEIGHGNELACCCQGEREKERETIAAIYPFIICLRLSS